MTYHVIELTGKDGEQVLFSTRNFDEAKAFLDSLPMDRAVFLETQEDLY